MVVGSWAVSMGLLPFRGLDGLLSGMKIGSASVTLIEEEATYLSTDDILLDDQ